MSVGSSGGKGWHHCGKCGRFFTSDPGAEIPWQCPACGDDPVNGEADQGGYAGARTEPKRRRSTSSEDPRPRRRGKLKGAVKFAAVWVVLLILGAGIVQLFRLDTADPEQEGTSVTMISEDQRLVNSALPECRRALDGFLGTLVPEARSEFVLDGSRILPRMLRLRQENQIQRGDENPELLLWSVLDTPRGKGIETMWDLGAGQRVEAVFFRDEEGAWKIDWEAMVRYSDADWALFVTGVGPQEGEFRLFARKRTGELAGEDEGSGIVLVAPRVGRPESFGARSPKIDVDPDSRIGRILETAFVRRELREVGAYGSTAVREDPPGMIRVRVLVRREGEVEKTVHLRDVVATHWLSIDELGISGGEAEEP